jgi:hypothetical protein
MRRERRIPISMMAAGVLALSMAACSGPQDATSAGSSDAVATADALDPIFAVPQVGDMYAAELTHFSGATFGHASGDPAYGLMRVIEVDDDKLTLHTETGAWPMPRGAINELRGDQADIEWDEQEKVRIYRRELAQLVADRKILEARRN